jgi:hypothetical protein
MIVESPSALRLMAALAEAGAAGATREHLAQRADISTTTFYRLIGPLVENALVKTSGSRYALALEKTYSFRFKQWHDMERLYRLSPADRDLVLSTAAALRNAATETMKALWLVGSGARDELVPESDLDFLLVTTDPIESLEPESSQRKVSVVQMSEAEFRDAYANSDSFVVSAITEGLLLEDRAFAQTFYSTPLPIQIDPQVLKAGRSQGDAFRHQLLQSVSIGDLAEATTALRSQAIHIGRLMLRPFGVLPANRRQLIASVRHYLGTSWADVLETSLFAAKLQKTEIVELSRRLSEERDLLQNHVTHLQRFATLPTSHGISFERLGSEVFKELIPFQALNRGSSDVDLRITTRSGAQYLIEFRSSTGPISDEALLRAIEKVDRAQAAVGSTAQSILVVNSHSDTAEAPSTLQSIVGPEALIRTRDEIYSRAIARTTNPSLVVLTGLQLLRTHNRMHLEPEADPSALMNALLIEGRRARLHIQQAIPEMPSAGSYYDILGEGGDPNDSIILLTFPDGGADGYVHRTFERTGDRTWAIRGVSASSVPSRQVFAVDAPAEFSRQMADWGDHWRRSKMARDVLSPEDLRHNIEELLRARAKTISSPIEVSDPITVRIAKRSAMS